VQPNLSVKKDVNSGDRTGARLAFLFKPNDNLTIVPRILYQKVSMDGWNRIDEYNILANPHTTTRPKVELGDRRQFTQFKEPFNDKFALGDLNVNYNIGGGMSLTSVTSYTHRVGVLKNRWDTAFLLATSPTTRRIFRSIRSAARARVSYLTNQPRTFGISTRVNF
jgi:hypothetical protein